MRKYAFLFFLIFLSLFLFSKNVFFAYKAPIGTKEVAVIGTFNGWSVSAGKMRRAFGNIWTVTLNIPNGTYFYDFWVDGKIIPDPTNPKKKVNASGGYYSILTVGVFEPPKGIIGDGKIHPDYVFFKENSRTYVNPASTSLIYFSIDTLKNDVQEVFLRTSHEKIPMKRVRLDGYTDRFETVFHPKSSEFSYDFELKDASTVLYDGNKGISASPTWFTFDFSHPCVKILNAPKWSKGAVVYEIFCDRFFNGNPFNDPADVCKWGGTPTYYNFFGGDLQGIIDKVEYLRTLGVNVLYTTPIFQAPSNHKYDTMNYMKIDPHFGTLKTFEKLVRKLHKSGIKWVLDGVFNHTGTTFFAFQDLLKNQDKSKYKNWYFVKRFPVKIKSGDYATFQNYPSLPKLNVDCPAVQRYLRSVIDYWTLKGIDGWRIDSANVISNDFLVKLYRWIHDVNPSTLDVAEIWSNASNWFIQGAFNSVMNYLFKDAAYAYVVYGAGAKSFENSTNSYLKLYPPQLWDSLWNLIDSHDTPRALSEAGSLEKMKLLVGLQMTFIGAPMIYYGDEVGLTGGADPMNRRCMPWNEKKWNWPLHNWYVKMIKIHENSKALKYGNYEPILAKGDVFAFKRQYADNEVYVFTNAAAKSATVEVPLNGAFEDLVSEKVWKIDGKATFPGYSIEVLKPIE